MVGRAVRRQTVDLLLGGIQGRVECLQLVIGQDSAFGEFGTKPLLDRGHLGLQILLLIARELEVLFERRHIKFGNDLARRNPITG